MIESGYQRRAGLSVAYDNILFSFCCLCLVLLLQTLPYQNSEFVVMVEAADSISHTNQHNHQSNSAVAATADVKSIPSITSLSGGNLKNDFFLSLITIN